MSLQQKWSGKKNPSETIRPYCHCLIATDFTSFHLWLCCVVTARADRHFSLPSMYKRHDDHKMNHDSSYRERYTTIRTYGESSA